MLPALPAQSFFLFGPRGTGKTAWLRERFPATPCFDLLDSATYTELLASPRRLENRIPANYRSWVLIDEIQRVPELLNEVHRLIEGRRLKFVMTGSSARKLRARGVNLLAGRALTRYGHPLTAAELGSDFDLVRAVRFGTLPFACTTDRPKEYLASYVSTYLREEVQQKGLTRNLAAFGRFLEAASFSQGSVLNMSAVARECGVHGKVAEAYFAILEDLMIAVRVPVFARRAKRRHAPLARARRRGFAAERGAAGAGEAVVRQMGSESFNDTHAAASCVCKRLAARSSPLSKTRKGLSLLARGRPSVT